MTQLLILREHIQKMYQRYSSFFQVVMRFMIGFGLFFAINRVLGYRPILSHSYVNVIMGVISVIFPLEAMIFLVALFIVLQVMYVSKMLAFCIGVIFLILYLLYIQFIPKHGYVLIAVPLAYSVGLSAGAPVLLGLLFGPAGVLPGVIGVLLYSLLQYCSWVLRGHNNNIPHLQTVNSQRRHNLMTNGKIVSATLSRGI